MGSATDVYRESRKVETASNVWVGEVVKNVSRDFRCPY